MDGDAFLYINGNDVCMCLTGLRDGSIREYLCDLFKKAALGDNAAKFDLQKVANIDKIKMLHKQGVKEIELRATMFQATHQYEVKKKRLAEFCGRRQSSLMTLYFAKM